MNTESIKQLATDVNNVALVSFQSGKEQTERPLLAKIEKLESVNKDLLEALKKIASIDVTERFSEHKAKKWAEQAIKDAK